MENVVDNFESEPLSRQKVAAGPTTRGKAKRLASPTLSTASVSMKSEYRRNKKVGPLCCHDLCLYVRWFSACGKSRVARLPLEPIPRGVSGLRRFFKQLIKGAYPNSAFPNFLTCPEYYVLSPADDFVSMPGDIARTHFRLVVTLDGWEYTVAERELGAEADPNRTLVVTVAEFETDTLKVGGSEVVVQLVSYPTVCVRQDFLDAKIVSLYDV